MSRSAKAGSLSIPSSREVRVSHESNPQAIGQKLLYSYPEAREVLGGVPQSTFALWIAKGILTPVRIGPRRCFIRHNDLIRLQCEGTPDIPKSAGRPKNIELPKAG